MDFVPFLRNARRAVLRANHGTDGNVRPIALRFDRNFLDASGKVNFSTLDAPSGERTQLHRVSVTEPAPAWPVERPDMEIRPLRVDEVYSVYYTMYTKMTRGLTDVHDQRERALAAALSLFKAQGIEAVTLRAIASEVNLTAMALYRYFPGGKSEVLATIRGRGFEELAARFEAAVGDVSKPIDQILALTVSLVRFALDSPGLYRLMFDFTQAEESDGYLASRRKLAWRRPGEAFAEAVRQGLLKGEPELLPHLVFAAVHGMISFQLSGQPQAERKLVVMLVPLMELLLRGAGATPAVLRKARSLAEPTLWTRVD
jgi:AcrR family transcriptional regulator